MKGPSHWNYVRVLAVPLLLWGVMVASLWKPIQEWLSTGKGLRPAVLREWIEESRDDLGNNLRSIVTNHLKRVDEARARGASRPEDDPLVAIARGQVREFLEVLATPPTRMYPSTFPLFLTVYRITVSFPDNSSPPIVWDSLLPEEGAENRPFHLDLDERATVEVRYHMQTSVLHREEAQRTARLRYLSGLAVLATILALVWVMYTQRREQQQDRQRLLAEAQVSQAERLLLREELLRKDAERRQQEAKLAAQEYEQKMLEMKSQLYASIGIMAGSYAHNIKNLLVRPNDLLRRCLEDDGVSPEQTHMLQEVRHTLGTVTERLQQILHTVRRDPTQSEPTRLDLRMILRNLDQTWRDLARERWKMQLSIEESADPLWIEGDVSHLQQAVENLLFNARDAIFEMRKHVRDQARQEGQSKAARQQGLIAAAAWTGKVSVRSWRDGETVVLEVSDNGIGMSEEVRQRCTETHFSTKRDNALFEGHSTGMGLGLSFVQVVLDNHGAKLEIESAPLQGATFRVRFSARG